MWPPTTLPVGPHYVSYSLHSSSFQQLSSRALCCTSQVSRTYFPALRKLDCEVDLYILVGQKPNAKLVFFVLAHYVPSTTSFCYTQLSNLWWMLNSVCMGFGTAMRTSSSGWFKRYPITYYIYQHTRGPWTAMPALIKVKETGRFNKHFYMEKKYSNLV